VTPDKPKSTSFYLEIREKPNQKNELTIVELDVLVDGIRHRLPLSADEYKKVKEKIAQKLIKPEEVKKQLEQSGQRLKRAGECVDDYNFVDRLYFVIAESNYHKKIESATVTVYPTTLWTTNVITPQGSRGTGGIKPEDMPITRIEDIKSPELKKTLPEYILENEEQKRGRIIITTTTEAKKPIHDTLLPYLVCSYNTATYQLLGATLYYSKQRKLNEDKKENEKLIEQYPLSVVEMDAILYSPNPQEAMAELFEQKIPQHMLLMSPFGDTQKIKSQFILPTNKMLLPQDNPVSATVHFVFDEAKLASRKEEQQTLSKRMTLVLSKEEQQQLQKLRMKESGDPEVLLEMGDLESAEASTNRTENTSPQPLKEEETKIAYAFDIYRDLDPGVTQEGQKPFYIIRNIIIHDRETGEAQQIELKQDTHFNLDLATAKTMLELLEKNKALSPLNKLKLQHHILISALRVLLVKEMEIDKSIFNNPDEMKRRTAIAALVTKEFPKSLLIDDSGLANFEVLVAFTTLARLSEQPAAQELAQEGILLLQKQRRDKITGLTQFDYSDQEKFKVQLTALINCLEEKFKRKEYLKAPEELKPLKNKMATPYVGNNAINPELLAALHHLLKVIPLEDQDLRQIMDAAITSLGMQHEKDLQQAANSLEKIDFSTKEVCEETFQHCVALLEAVYKAESKYTEEMNNAFAALNYKPCSIYINDWINTQWIANFKLIQAHLNYPNAKVVSETALKLLQQQSDNNVKDIKEAIPQDLSTDNGIKKACKKFRKLIALVSREDSNAQKNLSNIIIDIVILEKTPRINGLLNIRLIEKIELLAKANENKKIQEPAAEFFKKMHDQYQKDQQENLGKIKEANKRRVRLLNEITHLWKEFNDKVTASNVASGVDYRKDKQKQEEKFSTIQQQLIQFLCEPYVMELLFVQCDEFAQKDFSSRISALTKSVLTLSTPEKGYVRNYPNQAFYTQMQTLCDKLSAECNKLLSAENKGILTSTDKEEAEQGTSSLLSRRSLNRQPSKEKLNHEAEMLKAAEGKAEQRDAEQREAEKREAEQRQAQQLETARIEAEQREAEQRQAQQLEAARIEAEKREAEQRQAQQLEAARIEAEKREAEQRQAQQLEAARIEAEQREAEQRQAQQLETARIEAEKREAEQRQAQQLETARIEAEQREAEQRQAQQLETARIEAEKREAEKHEDEKTEDTNPASPIPESNLESKSANQKKKDLPSPIVEYTTSNIERFLKKEPTRMSILGDITSFASFKRTIEIDPRIETEKRALERIKKNQPANREHLVKKISQLANAQRPADEDSSSEQEQEWDEFDYKDKLEAAEEQLAQIEVKDKYPGYDIVDINALPESGIPGKNSVYFNKETSDFVILGTLGDNNQRRCDGKLAYLANNPDMAKNWSTVEWKNRLLDAAEQEGFIDEQETAVPQGPVAPSSELAMPPMSPISAPNAAFFASPKGSSASSIHPVNLEEGFKLSNAVTSSADDAANKSPSLSHKSC
ncbi:MAG: hypothetical protein K0R48_612, partial [Gammaproteobacteria bacterium]|nr:hypothetical protein [Gammaproteobacteria bacterium]